MKQDKPDHHDVSNINDSKHVFYALRHWGARANRVVFSQEVRGVPVSYEKVRYSMVLFAMLTSQALLQGSLKPISWEQRRFDFKDLQTALTGKDAGSLELLFPGRVNRLTAMSVLMPLLHGGNDASHEFTNTARNETALMLKNASAGLLNQEKLADSYNEVWWKWRNGFHDVAARKVLLFLSDQARKKSFPKRVASEPVGRCSCSGSANCAGS